MAAGDELDRTAFDEAAPLPSPPTAPDIGRYRIQSRLGAGAMGVVWLAVDPQLERKVAIKVVHPRLVSDPEASQRMLREARAMAKLSHRGVVAVYDAGETDDGRLFIAMELIDGETLTDRLKRPDLAPAKMWRERLALVLQAGRGLAAAHAAGVLHRDFKPDNVLVDRAGRVCVGDFGLATLGESPREHASNEPALGPRGRISLSDLTTTGALMGTPLYMSPEQLRGKGTTAAGDQFALCVAAYEALYRVRPFVGAETGLDAIPALIERIEAAEPATSDDLEVVPRAVRDVLLRGMGPRAEDRWPDIEAVLSALETASGLRARRRRRIALATGAVAVVVAAASTGALLHARATPHLATKRPLFRVPNGASIAVSSDGEEIAVGFLNVELHPPDGGAPLTIPFAHAADRVVGIGFDHDELGFSTMAHGERIRWTPATGLSPVLDQTSDRTWLARAADGDLYTDGRATNARTLSYVRDGKDVRQWPIKYEEVRTIAVSPDRTRLAYISQRTNQIVIVPLVGEPFRAPTGANPTALVWSDDHHLMLAKGTQVSPTISEIEIAADRVGAAKEIYRQPSGWIMRMATGGGRLVFIDGSPISRVRLVERDDSGVLTTRDFDSAHLAAQLGWTTAGELVVWNRNTLHLSHGPANGPFTDYPIDVPHEPANATFAGDAIIVSTRGESGRDIDAYNLSTGAHLWKIPDNLLAVRCADDRHAPCVAVRLAHDQEVNDRVLELDPATGALGKVVYEAPSIGDVALRGDGHLFIGTGSLLELDLDRKVTLLPTQLSNVRSIGFGPGGTLVTAGTTPRYVYVVEQSTPDGKFQRIMASETELVLLARASPDGKAIAVVGRSYEAELFELIR